MSKETELLIEIRSYLKEQIREYKHGSNAYNVLRKLETSIPNIINSHAQQSTVTDKFEKANNALKKYILANPDKVRKDLKAMRVLSTPSTKEVTDKEIEKHGEQHENKLGSFVEGWIKGAKWLRSQQKAGSEWVSVKHLVDFGIWITKKGVDLENGNITEMAKEYLAQPPNNKNR